MTEKSNSYLERMRTLYKGYGILGQKSLEDLARIQEQDNRIRELKIYREQPKTQEIIETALLKYKNCIIKLTSPTAMQMTDSERAYCFAAMDWAKYTLDIVGENPERTEKSIDDTILEYAKKSGL